MRNDKLSIGAKALAAGVVGGMIAVAPLTTALAGVPAFGESPASKLQAPLEQVHWRHCCWHHHHHGFTALVAAGTVSYPVYRIEHYKIDYTHPTFAPPVAGWFW